MAPTVLAFDIETIPDVEGLRQLRGFAADLPAADVVEMSQRLLRQERNSDFMPLHLQQVVVISCVLRHGGGRLEIFSLPSSSASGGEAEAITTFFQLIEKHKPVLASWNGSGFDLPVLHYRAMKHGIRAGAYWRTDNEYKWDNYISRYHDRHTDVMDVLALYQPRARVALDELSRLCGLPGKIGMGGGAVWDAWQRGDTTAVRHYCESDALLVYLLYIRFQQFRGKIDADREYEYVRRYLREDKRWFDFLTAWAAADKDGKVADAPPPAAEGDGMATARKKAAVKESSPKPQLL